MSIRLAKPPEGASRRLLQSAHWASRTSALCNPAFEARRAVAMQSIEDMQKMINELESMTVGFNIDEYEQVWGI